MECVGWIIAALLAWWGVYELFAAIPRSIERREAEEKAFWDSQGR